MLRQPFGGVKKSAIGFGRKVGIYNYITQFLRLSTEGADENLRQTPLSESLQKIHSAHKEALAQASLMAQSYAYHYEKEFSQAKDYVKIRGEENLFSYTPIKSLCFRICERDSLQDMLGVIIAAHISKVPLDISYEADSSLIGELQGLCKEAGLGCRFLQESLHSCALRVREYERVRYHALPCQEDLLYLATSKEAKIIIRDKPLLNGRFELLFYHNEKALSISYHRYANNRSSGNLFDRAYRHKAHQDMRLPKIA